MYRGFARRQHLVIRLHVTRLLWPSSPTPSLRNRGISAMYQHFTYTEQNTLWQCWLNVGPASQLMRQCKVNVVVDSLWQCLLGEMCTPSYEGGGGEEARVVHTHDFFKVCFFINENICIIIYLGTKTHAKYVVSF